MTKETGQKGSVLGGMLLVSGSAIGAGMLGLPVVTGIAGFFPSLVILAFCWTFMSVTALLLLEANLAAGPDSNIITMAHISLGRLGKGISFIVYIFLIYSMLVAYVDASGALTYDFFQENFTFTVTRLEGSLFFTILFGIFVYLGTLFVDGLNRLLMLGLIVTYVFVLIFGAGSITKSYFSHQVWGYSFLAIPVVITSFGYHNIIPTLTSYLKGNRKKMMAVVIFGGGLPLIIYVLWNGLFLGAVPYELFELRPSFASVLSFVPDPRVTLFSQYFALFAIITSFLAQALALVDFLRDAFNVKKNAWNRLWITLLVLAPPYFLARSFPGIFVKALGYVGGFAAIILFVLIPAFMVWELRYRRRQNQYKIMPGGRPMLFSVILIGLCIMAIEFLQEFFELAARGGF